MDPTLSELWCWIYPCGQTPDKSNPEPGRQGEVFCLPPAFAAGLIASGVLDRMNARFGYLLDFYEDEDVESGLALAYLAGSLEESFRQHELAGLVREVSSFLIESAEVNRGVTIWL